MSDDIKRAVLAQLSRVKGPDLSGDLVSLGLVSDIYVNNGKAMFSGAVPADRAQELEPLRKAAETAVMEVDGIEKVTAERFSFADCSLMNCIYAGAFLKFNRNVEQATMFIDRLFKLRGTVLPTGIENKKLVALRENGQMLYSEAEIVELRSMFG